MSDMAAKLSSKERVYGFSRPDFFVKKENPSKTAVFDTYWKFAAERQRIFMARLSAKSQPWTSDPILLRHKFTNAYRASDRVSQYLIRNVIYGYDGNAEDILFRILLFKIFNKIETWELLLSQFGEIELSGFSPSRFGSVLDRAIQSGGRIYSAAYIMPAGPKDKYKGRRKHEFHLELLDSLFKSDFPSQIIGAKDMENAYKCLLGVPSFGKFLAYQFVTDINYSDVVDFCESEFVVPGPGALDGIKKCFSSLGDRTPEDIIKMMADEQASHFSRLGLEFPNLWGRDLQLIDCQNLFCETDKYARVAHPEVSGTSGRTKIKQSFASQSALPAPWYPPKWGINCLVG